ncbi:hypothetical protein [Mucilaginibacter sp. OK283]|uniref:hypothetical protein n=1 Tax=Mucilaginibacter sp. OK283 TaxID=1881049 RepID=UPI000B85841E|nr:hypothetical protein [Mucilaginibacter sp. OK283]
MKNIICAALFLFIIPSAQAQAPASIIKRYKEIFKLIKADKAQELSKLVAYPLIRQNPLKDITNANEFVAYFPVLFDASFKKKFERFNDTVVFEHHGGYGLVGGDFHGDMWLDDRGNITGISVISRRETTLRNQLTKQIQSKIYPTVSHWDENLLVLQSPKLLIRIDRVGQKLRYVSWSQGRPTSSKPDLVLINGVEEAQGTQGGWTYTFKNGDWTYVIDDVEMCETASQCGYFLRLNLKNVEKSSTRLKVVK